MAKDDALEKYRQKRDFNITSEPSGGGKANPKATSFVIQKHWASRLHYDFRLEFEGTLKSWAVPKGPSLDPHDKRMAVQVEDHPLSYGGFEGTIPAKQYGAGKVIVWDSGTWLPLEDAARGFRDGKLKFELHGHKLKGRWTLVRMRGRDEKQPPWLLIKEHDEYERPAGDYNIVEAEPDSVKGLSAPEPAAKKAAAKPAAAKKTPAKETEAKTTSGSPGLPEGAVRAKLPALLEPQLATLVESAPTQGDWLYELKFDGYRLVARLDGSKVACITRNGHDWTDKMPQIATSLKALGLESAWLDGEIVVPDAQGIPNFQMLQNAFEGRGRRLAAVSPNAASIVYYIFDMPFYAGHDLRDVPLLERRALLQQVMKKNKSANLRFSDAFDAPSTDLVTSACKLGFEGLIGKRADSPYRSRRSSDWIKLKCGKRQEFLICGYTDPKGSRTGLGALLLGLHDDKGKLHYAGNVGSGFSEATLAELTKKLEAIATDTRPFDSSVAIPGRPHWVKPKLLAEISFAEWTHGEHIRHGVFRGLRTDKKPQAITREKAVKPSALKATAAPLKKAAVKKVAATKVTTKAATKTATGAVGNSAIALPKSLRVTHGERVIDKSSGVSKLDLIKHYAAVAGVMLPHIKGRPISLVRAPSGVGGELFFQKHAKAEELPGVKLLDPALDRDHDSLLEIGNITGLLSAAQMNTVEFHTWNATASNIDKPDRMTFDLDPGEGVAWAHMQEAALLVKTLVEELGLLPFLKTSGGKGLHVVIPLKRQHGWDAVKGFSQAIVQHLAKTIPQRFVAKSGPTNRVGKIFADYLRNGFGATTVSAWSARSRPGMGVSVPVSWDELPSLTSGAHWTVQNIEERIGTGNQPWADYAVSARSLSAAMKSMGYKAP